MIRVSKDEITIVGVATDKIDLTGAPQNKIAIVDCITKDKKAIFGHLDWSGSGPRVF